MTASDKIALFDLDGTLADFVAGMRKEMIPLHSPGESWDYDTYDQENEPDFMRARRRLVKNRPGFWRNLPLYQPGFKLLTLAVNIGFHITVFTKAPRNQPSAFAEKAEWCIEHLSPLLGANGYDIAMVTDKGGTYGRLLVDDWPSYIERWLQHRPRGKVVMPAHGYNKNYVRNGQVIRCGVDPETVFRCGEDFAREAQYMTVKSFMQDAFDR